MSSKRLSDLPPRKPFFVSYPMMGKDKDKNDIMYNMTFVEALSVDMVLQVIIFYDFTGKLVEVQTRPFNVKT